MVGAPVARFTHKHKHIRMSDDLRALHKWIMCDTKLIRDNIECGVVTVLNKSAFADVDFH